MISSKTSQAFLPYLRCAAFAVLLCCLAHGARAHERAPFGPWAALGVPVDASADEVKAAYRRLALEHHPDKGGDQDTFVEVQAAYEELTQNRPFWESAAAEHRRQRKWDAAKVRVRLKFAGGQMEMRGDVYESRPDPDDRDMFRMLKHAFEGQKLTYQLQNADGEVVMGGEGEGVFRSRNDVAGKLPQGPGSTGSGDVEGGAADPGRPRPASQAPPLPLFGRLLGFNQTTWHTFASEIVAANNDHWQILKLLFRHSKVMQTLTVAVLTIGFVWAVAEWDFQSENNER